MTVNRITAIQGNGHAEIKHASSRENLSLMQNLQLSCSLSPVKGILLKNNDSS